MGIEKLAKQNISHFWKDAGDVVLPEMKVRCGMEIIVFDGTYRGFPIFPQLNPFAENHRFSRCWIRWNRRIPNLLVVPPFFLDKIHVFWVKSLLLLIWSQLGILHVFLKVNSLISDIFVAEKLMVFLVKNQLVDVNLQTYARHLKISQAHTHVVFRKTIDIFPGSLSILSISRCEMLFDLHQPSLISRRDDPSGRPDDERQIAQHTAQHRKEGQGNHQLQRRIR